MTYSYSYAFLSALPRPKRGPMVERSQTGSDGRALLDSLLEDDYEVRVEGGHSRRGPAPII